MDNKDKPAFPKNRIEYKDKNTGEHIVIPSCNGLTKREYFAGLAMQGICSAIYNSEGEKPVNDLNLVNESIRIADELLKQLSDGK